MNMRSIGFRSGSLARQLNGQTEQGKSNQQNSKHSKKSKNLIMLLMVVSLIFTGAQFSASAFADKILATDEAGNSLGATGGTSGLLPLADEEVPVVVNHNYDGIATPVLDSVNSLPAGAYDLSTLYRTTNAGVVYVPYKITVNDQQMSRVRVLHRDLYDQTNVFSDETYLMYPGTYGPYTAMTIPGYTYIEMARDHDQVSGTIASGADVTVEFLYTNRATVFVEHKSYGGTVLRVDTYTITNGSYGPYSSDIFPGYMPGEWDPTSAPAQGTINPPEVKTVIYNYPQMGSGFHIPGYPNGYASLAVNTFTTVLPLSFDLDGLIPLATTEVAIDDPEYTFEVGYYYEINIYYRPVPIERQDTPIEKPPVTPRTGDSLGMIGLALATLTVGASILVIRKRQQSAR
ncbi:MAG: hypothetical protein LBG68_00050 [Coriobacteriales bacterium]|jgi:hypothetical protein|nr:hypothetical protein [Coriobacteriales bacterium]